jgi:hypothetical protein
VQPAPDQAPQPAPRQQPIPLHFFEHHVRYQYRWTALDSQLLVLLLLFTASFLMQKLQRLSWLNFFTSLDLECLGYLFSFLAIFNKNI